MTLSSERPQRPCCNGSLLRQRKPTSESEKLAAAAAAARRKKNDREPHKETHQEGRPRQPEGAARLRRVYGPGDGDEQQGLELLKEKGCDRQRQTAQAVRHLPALRLLHSFECPLDCLDNEGSNLPHFAAGGAGHEDTTSR